MESNSGLEVSILKKNDRIPMLKRDIGIVNYILKPVHWFVAI